MSYITNNFDDKVVELLSSGGIGFMPSDTIYGLSCRALDEHAVQNLRDLKSRTESKPLIVLISSLDQLKDLGMLSAGLDVMDKYWPGPVSLEWNASTSPAWLHPGRDTFAIRMPAKKELLDLIEKVGPIVSTSANPEGSDPAKSLSEARAYFGASLDFYVDVGIIQNPLSSTLVRLLNGRFEVLRQGAVKIDAKDQTR